MRWKSKNNTLTKQIKKAIGNRILFFSIAFMIIIFGLTLYDLSISFKQLRSRIEEQLKPIEDFAIGQAMINNLDTVDLKIQNFNESNNSSFKVEWVRQGVPIHKIVTWYFPFSWIYDYPIGEIAGFQFGYFKVTGNLLSDKSLIYDLLFRLSLFSIITISVICILSPLAKKIPEQLFIDPINHFIDLISNNLAHGDGREDLNPVELQLLERKILSLLTSATDLEKNKAAIEMSLEMLSKKTTSDDLKILKSGIRTIRDIANNVLDRHRNPTIYLESSEQIINTDGNIIRHVLLYPLIEMIISQKKHEWCLQPCEISLTIDSIAKNAWIKTAPNEIKRLLSNLMNNAYDALEKKHIGIIHIILSINNNHISLKLKDNGVGIPADKIESVLNGISLKHFGNGLGLSSAKNYIETLGGSLSISSQVGEGTDVTLLIPQASDISWLPKCISIHKSDICIIIDDDSSMLIYWKERLDNIGIISILFSTYHEAYSWVINNKHLLNSVVFIVDYELTGTDINGLVFIDEFGEKSNCYLVTSYAEEFFLQEAVKKSKVWLIAKSLINEIPLQIYDI